MSESIIVLKKTPGIAQLTLNRPDKRNALNLDLMENLVKSVKELENDPNIRILILSGEGPVFSSGLDLLEAQNLEIAEKSARLVAGMLQTIAMSSLCTISLVHGIAAGGGGGLAVACDFSIISEHAKIGFPEIRRGLVPALVSTLLVRKVKETYLKELLLLGELIDAKRAWEMGLVYKIVKEDSLLEEAMRVAKQLILGAPEAIRMVKNIINCSDSSLEHDLKKALDYHHDMRRTKEAAEGIAAFLDKREPKWQQ